jgi:outer membrane protein TolC
VEQAQASYQMAVLGALNQVENALEALRGDGLRLTRLRNVAAAAANANMLAIQRYSSGLVDFVDGRIAKDAVNAKSTTSAPVIELTMLTETV